MPKQQGSTNWDFDFLLAKQQIQEKINMPLAKYKKQEVALVKAGVDLRTKLGIWTLFNYVFNRLPNPIYKKYSEKKQLILIMTKLPDLEAVHNRYPQFWEKDCNLRSIAALDKFLQNSKENKYIFPAMNPERVFQNAQPHNFDIDKIRVEYKQLAKNYHPDTGGDEEQFHNLHRALERAIKLDQIHKTASTFAETLKENYAAQ